MAPGSFVSGRLGVPRGSTNSISSSTFSAARFGIPVEVYVIATILFAITVAAMGLTIWQQRRTERLVATQIDET